MRLPSFLSEHIQLSICHFALCLDVYNRWTSSDIANVFAAAAFRYGHSLIQEHFELASQDYESVEKTHISNVSTRCMP